MRISIDGVGTVEVGDEFKDMSPDDQNAFVSHITEQHAAGKKSGLPAEAPAAEPAQTKETPKYPNTIGGNIASAVETYVPQGVRDVARQARYGLTLGASDVLPGMFGGKPAKELQAETEAALERHPVAGEAARIGGMMAGMTPIARGVGMAAKGLEAIPLAGRLAANPITQAAATGAITGGTEAGIKGEDILPSAAMGATFGAGGQTLGEAVGSGLSSIGKFTRQRVGPTPEDLMAAKNAAYDVVKNSGTTFSTPSMTDLGRRLVNTYDEFGFSPHVTPKGKGPLKQYADMLVSGAATPQDVDNLLKVAGNMTQSIEKSDRKLGHEIKNTISDWLQTTSPNESADLMKARSLAAKTIKNRQIEEAVQKAQNRAEWSGRGGNLQNTLRQEIGKLKDKPGWSPEERKMMQEIVSGTPAMNIGRHISGMAPTTGVLPAMANIGLAGATGGASLLGSLGASGVKAATDLATKRKIGLLADFVRSGGKLPPAGRLERIAPKVSRGAGRLGLLAGGLYGAQQ